MQQISEKAAVDAVAMMTCGKATQLNYDSVEVIKEGCKAMTEWFVRLCNVCHQTRRVPDGWKTACIVRYQSIKGKDVDI